MILLTEACTNEGGREIQSWPSISSAPTVYYIAKERETQLSIARQAQQTHAEVVGVFHRQSKRDEMCQVPCNVSPLPFSLCCPYQQVLSTYEGEGIHFGWLQSRWSPIALWKERERERDSLCQQRNKNPGPVRLLVESLCKPVCQRQYFTMNEMGSFTGVIW